MNVLAPPPSYTGEIVLVVRNSTLQGCRCSWMTSAVDASLVSAPSRTDWCPPSASPQPDVLSDLKRDVEVVFAGLRAVEDKVDNIKSLLLSLAGRTMPSAANLPPIASTANIGYGSNPAFIGIPTAPTAPTAHGDGAARWSGDAGGGGRDPYMNGTPLALNYVTPLNFTSWQQHLNRERHAMPPQQPQPQRPGTDNDQCSIPQQVRVML